MITSNNLMKTQKISLTNMQNFTKMDYTQGTVLKFAFFI